MRLSDYFRLILDALLLRVTAYQQMVEERHPFQRGLVLIIVIGVLVAAVGILGTVLEAATTPDMAQIRATVYQGLTQMPWYQQELGRNPDFLQSFEQGYNSWWQAFGSWFQPNILAAIAGVILVPFSLIVGWLIYGLLAHLSARLLGGTATLAETYGATALGVAPQALNAISIVPYAQVGGLAIWGLVCNFLALKTAHRLSSGRAAWATILPFVLLLILAILLAVLVASVIAAVVANMGSAGR